MKKNILIEKKEQLYCELKTILNRQPGPEIQTQLESYNEILKEKKKINIMKWKMN